MIRKPHNLLFYFLALVPASMLLWWLWQCDFDLVDDAYIPMTYARNVAQGHGIVFYPGGERIEGYTSPLWMGWLTLSALCGFSLPPVAKFSSLCLSLAVVFLSVHVYRRLFYSTEPPFSFAPLFWPLMAGFAVVCDVSLAAYSVSGMESAAYSFLLLLLAYFLFSHGSDFMVCILMLFVALIRPEGPAFWFFGLLYWYFQKRLSNSLVLLFLITVIIPYSVFIGLRLVYFGQPFPNTFYAKHDFGGFELLRRGFEYTFYFFRPRPLYLFALLGFLIEEKNRRSTSLWFFAFVLLHIGLVTLEGGDHFTLHRFMIPAISFFSILSIRGLSLCAERLVQERWGRVVGMQRVLVNGILAIVMLFLLPAYGKQLYEYKTDTHCRFAQGSIYHQSVVKWTRSWVKVGQWLKEKYSPETQIAVINAGAIPYYCELRCIDMLGLNDRVIAHTPVKYETLCLPGHDKSNSDYVLQQKPQLIQLFPLLFFASKPYPEENLGDMITYPAQIDMWQEQRFHDQYQYRTEETPYGFISFFERREDVNR